MPARITLPKQIKRGVALPVRIAVLHPMETGYRYDVDGRSIPKNVIHTLTCRYANEIVFRAEMGSGMAANPNVQFYLVPEQSGELVFEWIDDTGLRGSERATLTVSE
ncbi:MAG: thiosulfate oxidation carrier complex protein SoxZ [Usitatibacteraceae bacterium]